MVNWKREIVIAHLIKQKTSELDVNRLWEYPFPEVAASEGSVIFVEQKIGFSLDKSHREFLLHADGWKSFWHAADILGTSDFLGGRLYDYATDLLKSLENLSAICGFQRSELLPIAVSTNSIDLFAISTSNSHRPGVVFWFAGQLIEEFKNFEEWFLSMVDYNRFEYQQFEKEANS